MFWSNSLYIRKPCTIFFYEKVVKWCYKGKLVYLDGEGAAGVHLCWIWRIYIYERELFRRKVILCDERKEFGDDMQDMYDTMVQYIKEEQK